MAATYTLHMHLSDGIEQYLIKYAEQNGMKTFSYPDKIANALVQIVQKHIELETAKKVNAKSERRKNV